MAKKDGLEIFELFRNGSKGTAEAPRPASIEAGNDRGPSTSIRIVSKPEPAATPPRAAGPATPDPKEHAGDTVISMKLNTALFGLMVGAACLFGSFALGVQWERRQHPGEPVAARPAAEEESSRPPTVAREAAPRRETPPAARESAPVAPKPPAAETRPAATEPKKGWSLQIIAYTEDQQSTAQTMVDRIRGAGGEEASIIKTNQQLAILAGFFEKQSSPEAQALLRKYQNVAVRLNKSFNLGWVAQTR